MLAYALLSDNGAMPLMYWVSESARRWQTFGQTRGGLHRAILRSDFSGIDAPVSTMSRTDGIHRSIPRLVLCPHTGRDLCKKAFPPTTETQTQVFGCFRP